MKFQVHVFQLLSDLEEVIQKLNKSPLKKKKKQINIWNLFSTLFLITLHILVQLCVALFTTFMVIAGLYGIILYISCFDWVIW